MGVSIKRNETKEMSFGDAYHLTEKCATLINLMQVTTEMVKKILYESHNILALKQHQNQKTHLVVGLGLVWLRQAATSDFWLLSRGIKCRPMTKLIA